MSQPGTDQHEGSVSVRKDPRHTGAAVNLPVESLNHIVGPDPSPVFGGKVTVGQCFPNTVLYFLSRLFQLHFPQLSNHGFSLFTSSLLTLLSVDGF